MYYSLHTVSTIHSTARWLMLFVFFCLEYSFQFQELSLIHKILVCPTGEVYAPAVLGQAPWIDGVIETGPFPSET